MENEKIEEGKNPVSTQETTPPEATKPEDSTEPEIDYRAELEKTRAQLSKAEYKLRKQNIESKKKDEEEEAPERLETDVDTLIEQKVSQRLEEARIQDAADTIEDTLDGMSSTPEEKELIRLHYDNSIVKSGFSKAAIKSDLAKAKLLANAPRYLKNASELAESLRSKKTMATAGKGSNLDKPTQKDDLRKHFDDYNWNWMKSRGWSDEKIRNAIPR